MKIFTSMYYMYCVFESELIKERQLVEEAGFFFMKTTDRDSDVESDVQRERL